MPKNVVVYDDSELDLKDGWDEGLDPDIRRDIRNGRIAKREAAKQTERAEAAERELTLYRAGIPGDVKGQAFAKVYEGDREDPEAIKAAYEELFGPVSGAPASGGPDAGDPAAAARRVASAGNDGGGGTGGGAVDLAQAIKGASTTEEVLEIVRRAQRENPEAHIRVNED